MSQAPSDHLASYLSEVALAVAIAVVGGLARVLQSQEPLTARSITTGALTSAFCGVVLALALGEYGVGPLFRAAAVGLSGWAGPAMLPIITERLKKMAANWTPQGPGPV